MFASEVRGRQIILPYGADVTLKQRELLGGNGSSLRGRSTPGRKLGQLIQTCGNLPETKCAVVANA